MKEGCWSSYARALIYKKWLEVCNHDRSAQNYLIAWFESNLCFACKEKLSNNKK